jgi:hypothetical protein
MANHTANKFRTDLWKEDSIHSVDFYNQWFMESAPEAYRVARAGVVSRVILTLKGLNYLYGINLNRVIDNPQFLSVLRACTAPPIAVDRLAGLSGTTKTLIKTLENGKVPSRMDKSAIEESVARILNIVNRLLDFEIFPWLRNGNTPSAQMLNRSSAIIADRISGTLADPIIRNSQEARQFKAIDEFLQNLGYIKVNSNDFDSCTLMPPKSYAHHMNVPVRISSAKEINMPIDVVIQTTETINNQMPILVECKSAGDFTNTNKRRKEEAIKVTQLRNTYGVDSIKFVLFLCGYFDTSYLGYEASENIDWVWEHRISDFLMLGI